MVFDVIQSPAEANYGIVGGKYLFAFLTSIAFAFFIFVLGRRVALLRKASPDPRFSEWGWRASNLLQYWLAQWKQPRYFGAGLLHIAIFAGFMLLLTRTMMLTVAGIAGETWFGRDILDSSALFDYGETVVFVAVVSAAVRRMVFRPSRYAGVSGNDEHRREAVMILALIAALMLSASLFDASRYQLRVLKGIHVESPAVLSLAWWWVGILARVTSDTLSRGLLGSYLVHQLLLLSFLCLLPFGKHFHVLTSFFNVMFARTIEGQLKPARWGCSEQEIQDSQSLGVKTLEDFTWKHILDFYSCADCGRCSDQCPSKSTGRPLSPRALTIKARDYAFTHYPAFGKAQNGARLVGAIYAEDEIWSCTTCGACEEECPLLVEYIDKIVDLRRGLVDDGKVPSTLQKPLAAIERRGNPYGKPEKKRADWTTHDSFPRNFTIPVVDGQPVETLYFVDSITSYDDRMQSIARSTARILNRLREDFGILGPAERDSGHEVRRFGEEILFFSLRDHNTRAIQSCGARRIVTSDPHAYNALKRDYTGLPRVEHTSEVLARALEKSQLRFVPTDAGDVYTFHDPCYLGRHNRLFDAPRNVLDAIPGMKRVEMKRCRDRSFCCGGGGLMLFHEPKQEERMGVVRVRMAVEAGANVIVTACPYCLTNVEDAIKVAGLEHELRAIDLVELADQQLAEPKLSPNA